MQSKPKSFLDFRKAVIRCKDILIKAEVDRREAEANDGQQQGPGEEFFYLA